MSLRLLLEAIKESGVSLFIASIVFYWYLHLNPRLAAQRVGILRPDRIDHLGDELVDLLGRTADELRGIEHGGQVDPGEGYGYGLRGQLLTLDVSVKCQELTPCPLKTPISRKARYLNDLRKGLTALSGTRRMASSSSTTSTEGISSRSSQGIWITPVQQSFPSHNAPLVCLYRLLFDRWRDGCKGTGDPQ